MRQVGGSGNPARRASAQRIDAILNETRAHGDRVVEPARDGVGLVRVPIHPRRARFFCRVDDGRDQRSTDAAASYGLADIKILEIALRIDEPCAALKQIVREANQVLAALGDQRMDRLERIKNAREGGVGDLVAPLSAVKNEIGPPQRLPLRAIRMLNRAHPEIWQSPPSPLVRSAIRRIDCSNRLDKCRSEGLLCPRRQTSSAMEPEMTRSPFILAGVAALMGAAGVALAAAGVHANGGELAQRGGPFLLLHAVAALAIAAHARIGAASARALLFVGFVMEAGGGVCFSRAAPPVFPRRGAFFFSAPIGGTTMILSWLALAAVFAAASRRKV